MERELLTPDVYWAAQPPEVRVLRGMTNRERAIEKALELARKGYIIDKEIMVLGGDPLFVMQLRADYGYTWVPNVLQPPVAVAPNLWFPPMPMYDPSKIPAGAIRVSVLASDYPPFDRPVVEEPRPKVIVGPPVFAHMTGVGSMWYSGVDDSMVDGERYVDGRGTFVKRSVASIGGRQVWWEKVSNAAS